MESGSVDVPVDVVENVIEEGGSGRGGKDARVEDADISTVGAVGEAAAVAGGDGGKKKKKSGGREQSRDVGISKALSKILRHDAVKEGFVLDGEGFGNVAWLLQWKRLKSLKCEFDDIKFAVSDNAKQRFALKPDPTIGPAPELENSTDPKQWLIRANQGHSIALESSALLTPITLEAGNIPETVIHGSYYAFYAPITSSKGLSPMGRNHIHFSTGLPSGSGEEGPAVVSGMRNDAEILFYIDVRRSLEDGAAQWWLSDNGVVLSEGGEDGAVGKKYWKKVVGRRQDVGVLWEDGVEVAELPQTVRDRKAPSGKGPRGKQQARGGRPRDAGRGGKKGGRGDRMKELDALGGEEGLNGT